MGEYPWKNMVPNSFDLAIKSTSLSLSLSLSLFLSLSLSLSLSLRFSCGIKEREAQQRITEESSRAEAAARQRGPYDSLTIEELKNRIKERSGKRLRFTGKQQLIDIMIELDRQRESQERTNSTKEPGPISGKSFDRLMNNVLLKSFTILN